jgi:hypothetical protein
MGFCIGDFHVRGRDRRLSRLDIRAKPWPEDGVAKLRSFGVLAPVVALLALLDLVHVDGRPGVQVTEGFAQGFAERGEAVFDPDRRGRQHAPSDHPVAFQVRLGVDQATG